MIDKGDHNISYALVTFINFALEGFLATDPQDISKVARVGGLVFGNLTLGLRSYAEVGIRPPKITTSYAREVQLTKDDVILPLAQHQGHWGHRVWLSVLHDRYTYFANVAAARFPTYSAAQRYRVVESTMELLVISVLINDYIPFLKPGVNLTGLFQLFDTRHCNYPLLPDTRDVEFTYLYQWHNLIPDFIRYKQPIPVSYTIRNASGYSKYSTRDHVEAFARTRTGSNGTLNNEPIFMRTVTAETIRRARKLNLGSLNDLREKYKLARYLSFDAFGPQAAAVLKTLYRSVDDIDAQAALAVDFKLVSAVITSGALARIANFLIGNCREVQVVTAALKDVIFDPRGPFAALTNIDAVDGRHPFMAPPKVPSLDPQTPQTPPTECAAQTTTIGFGLATGIVAPRIWTSDYLKNWRKINSTVYTFGNVALSYTSKHVLNKIQLGDGPHKGHTITFGVGVTTIDGDTFNNTAIPHSWMPGGCNAAMGGLHYFRPDRDYFPIFDVFTKSGCGPVLTGVVFVTHLFHIDDPSALDFGGRVLRGARSGIEATTCRDHLDYPTSISVATQHIQLLARSARTRCQHQQCADGNTRCFACGPFTLRTVLTNAPHQVVTDEVVTDEVVTDATTAYPSETTWWFTAIGCLLLLLAFTQCA